MLGSIVGVLLLELCLLSLGVDDRPPHDDEDKNERHRVQANERDHLPRRRSASQTLQGALWLNFAFSLATQAL